MSLKNNNYLKIGEHYTECFKRHGDNNLGVDWPNEVDATMRYEVMLRTLFNDARLEEYSILDFGCGTSALYDFIIKKGVDNKINYTGIVSSQIIHKSINHIYCRIVVDIDLIVFIPQADGFCSTRSLSE